jgi:membrane-associated protein
MFEQFTDLVSNASGWAYLIIFALAYFDALVPVVPSETSVITAGVVASTGDLNLMLIVAVAASGAFLGDNTAYFIGRRYGTRINDRFFSSQKARKRVEWAHKQVSERGGELILVARFIPGGRTVVTLSCGTLGYPWRRFLIFDAAGRSSGPSTRRCSDTLAATLSRTRPGRAFCSHSRSRSLSRGASSSCGT